MRCCGSRHPMRGIQWRRPRGTGPRGRAVGEALGGVGAREGDDQPRRVAVHRTRLSGAQDLLVDADPLVPEERPVSKGTRHAGRIGQRSKLDQERLAERRGPGVRRELAGLEPVDAAARDREVDGLLDALVEERAVSVPDTDQHRAPVADRRGRRRRSPRRRRPASPAPRRCRAASKQTWALPGGTLPPSARSRRAGRGALSSRRRAPRRRPHLRSRGSRRPAPPPGGRGRRGDGPAPTGWAARTAGARP